MLSLIFPCLAYFQASSFNVTVAISPAGTYDANECVPLTLVLIYIFFSTPKASSGTRLVNGIG